MQDIFSLIRVFMMKPTNKMYVRIAYHRTYVLIPRLKISNNFIKIMIATGIHSGINSEILNRSNVFYVLVYLTFVISMYENYFYYYFYLYSTY